VRVRLPSPAPVRCRGTPFTGVPRHRPCLTRPSLPTVGACKEAACERRGAVRHKRRAQRQAVRLLAANCLVLSDYVCMEVGSLAEWVSGVGTSGSLLLGFYILLRDRLQAERSQIAKISVSVSLDSPSQLDDGSPRRRRGRGSARSPWPGAPIQRFEGAVDGQMQKGPCVT
jgi:hypothetical protein